MSDVLIRALTKRPLKVSFLNDWNTFVLVVKFEPFFSTYHSVFYVETFMYTT